jgi:cyclopropane fatty-acyl-phospholipid synthase-like methyltransferase
MGYMISAAIYVAAKLGIADLLANGPKPVAELAKATSTNEDALYRTLRTLAGSGIFTETSGRKFGLTPVAEGLLTGRDSSRDAIVWLADPFHFGIYADLMHSVKTGKPAAEHVYGAPLFEVFARKELAEEAQVFNTAMTSFSAQTIPAVLEVYDFSGIGTLMDVAGGHGYLLTSILQKYPKMRGVITDLAHVVNGAESRIQELGLSDRCTACAGDFFQSVPSGVDAIIMKHIIHDWDDERAITILTNCRKALPANGKVILLESVLPEGNEPHFGKILDLEMLALPGGLERTEAEYRRLFEKAGLRLNRVVPTKSPLSVVDAVVE